MLWFRSTTLQHHSNTWHDFKRLVILTIMVFYAYAKNVSPFSTSHSSLDHILTNVNRAMTIGLIDMSLLHRISTSSTHGTTKSRTRSQIMSSGGFPTNSTSLTQPSSTLEEAPPQGMRPPSSWTSWFSSCSMIMRAGTLVPLLTGTRLVGLLNKYGCFVALMSLGRQQSWWLGQMSSKTANALWETWYNS